MILDWDVHHGNGTQNIFYNTNQVLYMSMHRYENATFYPKSKSGEPSSVGDGDGAQHNVNVAFNNDTMEDKDYVATFLRIVLPIAYEYKPDVILVSAGFDACIGDPLGGYRVSPEAFGHFLQLLKPTCGGKMILALEGGYNTNSVAYSVVMCCKALLGDPLPPLKPVDCAAIGALNAIDRTIAYNWKRWKLLQHEMYIVGKVAKGEFDAADPSS